MPSSYYSDRERILREFSAKAHFTGAKENESARPNSPKTRVVIADTHQPIRTAAAGILSTTCKAEVIGCASDGARAIDDVLRLKPDILVLEVVLPVVDGIQVTRALKNAKTQTKIVILTTIVDGSFQQAAMKAGAHAYVIKARMLTDLPLAVRAVLEGATFHSPEKT